MPTDERAYRAAFRAVGLTGREAATLRYRNAVDAAAPIIAANALREAAGDHAETAWLRDRADQLEQGEARRTGQGEPDRKWMCLHCGTLGVCSYQPICAVEGCADRAMVAISNKLYNLIGHTTWMAREYQREHANGGES